MIEAGEKVDKTPITGSVTAITLTHLVWAVLKGIALQKELKAEVAQLSDELSQEDLKDASLFYIVSHKKPLECMQPYLKLPRELCRITVRLLLGTSYPVGLS